MRRKIDVRQEDNRLQLTADAVLLINGFSACSCKGPSVKQEVGGDINLYSPHTFMEKIVTFVFCREKQLSSIINIMGNTTSVSKVGHIIKV